MLWCVRLKTCLLGHIDVGSHVRRDHVGQRQMRDPETVLTGAAPEPRAPGGLRIRGVCKGETPIQTERRLSRRHKVAKKTKSEYFSVRHHRSAVPSQMSIKLLKTPVEKPAGERLNCKCGVFLAWAIVAELSGLLLRIPSSNLNICFVYIRFRFALCSLLDVAFTFLEGC